MLDYKFRIILHVRFLYIFIVHRIDLDFRSMRCIKIDIIIIILLLFFSGKSRVDPRTRRQDSDREKAVLYGGGEKAS